jgi:hypothetical protein
MARHDNRVLVLNADYRPIAHCSVPHAFRMLNRGVATVEEEHPELTFGIFNLPLKLRLLRYVNMSWFYAKPVHWSKSGVLLRDRKICVYCKGKADTIDHIVPQSRGGGSTWENTVACCFRCNQKKDNKTLEQMGWHLDFIPGVPSRIELQTLKLEFISQQNNK